MKPPACLKEKISPTRPAVLAVAILFLLAAALPSFGLTIHFKLSGSYSLLSPDDVNRSLSGWGDLMKKRAAATPGWTYEGGKAGRIRGGFDLEGELLLDLAPRWAVGIGSGYSYGVASESATALDILHSSVPYVYARPTKITATPVVMSGYRFWPLGRKFSLYVRAGIGRLWAKYADLEAVRKASDAGFSYTNARSASGRGTLVLVGAGIKYAHDGSLGFFLEAVWRRAKVNAFGNGTGTLYFFEEYDPDLDFWQAKMSLLDGPPAGETFRSVRKAAVDYGGLIIKLGFFVKF
ncbi:MAG TPA: hypothetical protein VHP61_08155 [Acidobacteriota bacterium]|nr:hypothetical protein [Acidobacteriota bacterium]